MRGCPRYHGLQRAQHGVLSNPVPNPLPCQLAATARHEVRPVPMLLGRLRVGGKAKDSAVVEQSPVSADLLQDLGDVACPVKHGDDGHRITGRVVYDQVGIDAPELQGTVGEIFTRVADARPRRYQDERILEREHDLHCGIDVVSGL